MCTRMPVVFGNIPVVFGYFYYRYYCTITSPSINHHPPTSIALLIGQRGKETD